VLGSIHVFGVPVRFHFTFWLVVVWLVYLGVNGEQSAAGTALYVGGLLVSVLLHELGHTLAARQFSIGIAEVIVLPLGGLSRLSRQPRPSEEFWVALAGPAVNLVLGGGLLGWAWIHGGAPALTDWRGPSDANLFQRLAVANLSLALFNLLPAFPMDGGRVTRSLLAARWDIERATRATARIGTLLAAAGALFGLLNSNFLFVFIAFFVYAGASQEVLATTTQQMLLGALVGEAMLTDFRTLSHGDTIREAAELLLATSQQDFPVLHGGQVVGLLNRGALLRALASDGPDGYVAGAMERDFVRLDAAMGLSLAVRRMNERGSCAMVFEADRLIGLLTAENLSEFLVLRRIGSSRRDAEAS
jgi:Zn-dependent protease/CBS domain-containing protein